MLKFNPRDGFSYVSDRTKKEYTLEGLRCLGGSASSDKVIIWDNRNGDDPDQIVGWFYGEDTMIENLAELEKTVAEYVTPYERRKRNEEELKRFEGFKAHMHEKLDAAFAESDNCDEFYNAKFVLSFMGKTVEFYVCPESFESFEVAINTQIELLKEDIA